MDFIDELPHSRSGHTNIWVVVDRLTKSAHFIPIKYNRMGSLLSKLYIKEIMRLQGVPSSIMCDRDPLFTSHFQQSIQQALGTKLYLSIAYHRQSNGHIEQVNRILKDLLRACILDFGGSWEDHLPLVEFTYNNSCQTSIGMAPFKPLYKRLYHSPSCWLESKEKLILGPESI